SIKPLAESTFSASRSAVRLTAMLSARSSSRGNRSPGRKSPTTIRLPSSRITWPCRLRESVAFIINLSTWQGLPHATPAQRKVGCIGRNSVLQCGSALEIYHTNARAKFAGLPGMPCAAPQDEWPRPGADVPPHRSRRRNVAAAESLVHQGGNAIGTRGVRLRILCILYYGSTNQIFWVRMRTRRAESMTWTAVEAASRRKGLTGVAGLQAQRPSAQANNHHSRVSGRKVHHEKSQAGQPAGTEHRHRHRCRADGRRSPGAGPVDPDHAVPDGTVGRSRQAEARRIDVGDDAQPGRGHR